MRFFGREKEPAVETKELVKQEEGALAIPTELPILPLRNTVVFPFPALLPLAVDQPRSIRLVDDAALGERMIGLVAMKDPRSPEPGPEEIYHTGTAALIHRLFKAPDGSIRLFVTGVERIKIRDFTQMEPYLKARVQVAPDMVEETLEVEALMRNTIELFRRLVELMPHLPEELVMAALSIDDPRQVIYLVAGSIRMEVPDAQEVLEIDDIKGKLQKLTAILNRELEVLELGKKIQSEAQSEMTKMQREYFLREQLKAIKKELGEADERTREIEEYREKIEAAGMSEEAEKEALRELSRLEGMPAAAAEYSVIKTYLDWLISLPWQVSTEDNLDINRARQILDEDHYDLDKIKERILEYLAVRKLHLERAREGEGSEPFKGPILCFVGPPGTGKTSLGQSIARALGRKFIRMSLGGMRDEAEIRGHRRTYIGAMPGRIIQSIKRVGTRNPVFMLDEVDKVGADWRGDPSSALLEVLDPAQNAAFRDHYLDVDWDLSEVMFITTANLLEPIAPPLRDRMEIIQLDGYTEEEKVKIAQGYLIPRQIKENSLRPEEITFEEDAIREIIRNYTREAGVRNLEREIAGVCRKVATKIASGEVESVVVTRDDVREYLGRPRFYFEAAERTEIPGVATGLAVTSVGGDVMFIEATRMKGGKGLTITGRLGEVMKESAQAALSYVRAKARDLGIPEDFFQKSDIHLHVPAGATPKDGPSAGVTMATALASLLTGRCVKPDVGMTGEITLRGQVLPVGGIKQKVLAAHRAGLTTVILPRRNEPDLEELPEEVRQKMNFVFVDTIDQVLEAALYPDGRTPELEEAPSEAEPAPGLEPATA
ncbi:MAG: endopeptidase La [Anaerolineae bacterium]